MDPILEKCDYINKYEQCYEAITKRILSHPHPIFYSYETVFHKTLCSQVLGADDVIPEPPQPFEEVPSVAPDTWDVGEDEEEGAAGEGAAWAARHARLELYDQLCRYFRPSAVPPSGDITDLVAL